MDRSVNLLAFGLPGTRKTHALCAVGHRLVEAGRLVLFTPAYRLVQDLLFFGQAEFAVASGAAQAGLPRFPAHR